MNKKDIFRDTKNFYLKTTDYVSSDLTKFVLINSGQKILDVGCATGEYCKKLNGLGFKCTGVDINPKYVEKACQNGIEAHIMRAEDLKFPNNSFDTILLFEVLEHVDNPLKVLKESKRVARKNILITVPNCTQFHELRASGLTYEHMLEKDHVNFFKKDDLENLLSKEFKDFNVIEGDAITLSIANLPSWVKYPLSLLYKINLITENCYFRLYAEVAVER